MFPAQSVGINQFISGASLHSVSIVQLNVKPVAVLRRKKEKSGFE